MGVFKILAAPVPASQPALRVYGIDDGLNFPQVFRPAQDHQGFVWVGTSFGVGRYDGQGFTRLTRNGGLPHDSVLDLAEASDGSLWIGTDGDACLRQIAAALRLRQPAPGSGRPLRRGGARAAAAGHRPGWRPPGRRALPPAPSTAPRSPAATA